MESARRQKNIYHHGGAKSVWLVLFKTKKIMITYLISVLLISLLSIIVAKKIVKERRHKKKQSGIAKAYDRLTREFKLAVEYSEFINYRYIGLDRRNKKLIIINHCSDQKEELCFPLSEIGDSKIIREKDESQYIKRILLEFRNKRNNQPVRFCFYNRKVDPVAELPSLSRKAIHWKTKVDIHKHPGSVSFEAEYVL
jgi:hypothetical protein